MINSISRFIGLCKRLPFSFLLVYFLKNNTQTCQWKSNWKHYLAKILKFPFHTLSLYILEVLQMATLTSLNSLKFMGLLAKLFEAVFFSYLFLWDIYFGWILKPEAKRDRSASLYIFLQGAICDFFLYVNTLYIIWNICLNEILIKETKNKKCASRGGHFFNVSVIGYR